MSHPHSDLLEIILRECAASHPQPWYPSTFSRSTGVPREPLESCLDQLRMGGLVQLTPWVQEYGQGYQLTQHGSEVLQHPRLLAQLRNGDVPATPAITARRLPPSSGTFAEHRLDELRGEQVRRALLDDSRPIVTQVLLLLNILWFVVELAALIPKFGGPANFSLALAKSDLVIRHEWWRLLSYGFEHANLMHIVLNMFALYNLGPLLERIWGRPAYLSIYLISCVGGGAAAVLLMPSHATVGASGAICGLLGSMPTWLLLNRTFLPPHLVQDWQRQIMMNIVLIAVLSFLPGISWAGHLGGGVAGALLGVPLNLAHFGSGTLRWLGWGAAAAAVVLGLGLLHVELDRSTDDRTRAQLEIKAAAKELQQLDRADEVAIEACNRAEKLLQPVKHQWPGDDAASELAKKFRQNKQDLEGNLIKLKQLGPFQQPQLDDTFKKAMNFFALTAPFCEKMAQALQSKQTWTNPQREVLWTEYKEIHKAYKAFAEAARKFKEAVGDSN